MVMNQKKFTKDQPEAEVEEEEAAEAASEETLEELQEVETKAEDMATSSTHAMMTSQLSN